MIADPLKPSFRVGYAPFVLGGNGNAPLPREHAEGARPRVDGMCGGLSHLARCREMKGSARAAASSPRCRNRGPFERAAADCRSSGRTALSPGDLGAGHPVTLHAVQTRSRSVVVVRWGDRRTRRVTS